MYISIQKVLSTFGGFIDRDGETGICRLITAYKVPGNVLILLNETTSVTGGITGLITW